MLADGVASAKDIDTAMAPFGLATTMGNAYTVGAAGLLMGGGTGFHARWQARYRTIRTLLLVRLSAATLA